MKDRIIGNVKVRYLMRDEYMSPRAGQAPEIVVLAVRNPFSSFVLFSETVVAHYPHATARVGQTPRPGVEHLVKVILEGGTFLNEGTGGPKYSQLVVAGPEGTMHLRYQEGGKNYQLEVDRHELVAAVLGGEAYAPF